MPGWFKRRKAPERRAGYSDLILSALEANAATQAADAGKSAAVEAASGLLARTLGNARVEGPDWFRPCPTWIAQVARELIRNGDHLSLVRMDALGNVTMIPCAHYHWHSGGPVEADWMVSATAYGPSGSWTRYQGRGDVFFVRWSRLSLEPHRGNSPASLASLTAKAAAETEKSLGDESSGPVAQILTIPDGQDGDDAELAGIRSGLANARGKALLLETTAKGHGNVSDAPQRDWVASRLGPSPPAAMVEAAQAAYARMLAVCGASPALFTDADGTSQREAWRRWHLTTVKPVKALIEHELSRALGMPVQLHIDEYAADLAGRAAAFQKLVAGGMDVERAAAVSGILVSGDE